MRNDSEQMLALECLKLAVDHVTVGSTRDLLNAANQMLAFVTGEDIDAAKITLSQISEIIRYRGE